MFEGIYIINEHFCPAFLGFLFDNLTFFIVHVILVRDNVILLILGMTSLK